MLRQSNLFRAACAASFCLALSQIGASAANPAIGEASANRRATEAEMRQTQSTLLPQVRLEASAGPERLNNPEGRCAPGTPNCTIPPIPFPFQPGTLNNDQWVAGAKGSLIVRQLLFDGFATIHDIWRQWARVDAAAARSHERSELTALDAAEAYIDVVRYTRLVALAQENVQAHRKILANVQQRFQGGRAGEGDLEQTKERVDAAEVAVTEFRRSLEDARAKFRKVVGVEPYNLRAPGRLHGLPPTKDQVLAVTLTDNPTIKAAQSDVDAARQAFHASAGRFYPTVTLEGRATEGHDTDTFPGHYMQESLKVVASWDVFRGGQDAWNRTEQAERFTQASMAHARLQRDAYESVDKAWAARVITVQRIAKLQEQIASDRKVITAYSKEYDLGQRSLIDLLNAENQLFNAQVSLESARGVAVFADYQLLAAMGRLLAYLKAPHPVDAEPVLPSSFGLAGLIPNRLPPLLITLPHPGSEPLNVVAPLPMLPGYGSVPFGAPPSSPPPSFAERWAGIAPATSLGYAADMFSPQSLTAGMPSWPAEVKTQSFQRSN
jgi:adhesin transport system outer membrane protein